jgi:hypothetical protein
MFYSSIVQEKDQGSYINFSDSPQPIIDMEFYNGRVNVEYDLKNTEKQFEMLEKVAVRNKATEYRDALTGSWEDTTLSRLYFSAQNIEIIQNGLRAGVYNMSGGKYVIAPQNVDHLKIIMRGIYLDNCKNSKEDIKGQIQTLNQLVLDYCIHYVFNETVAYIKYLRDQSTLVVPLERDKKVDRDYKQLQYQPW